MSWRTGNLFHDCQDSLASVDYVGLSERMKIGDVITWERTFTREDIRPFNKVSGDEGVHHVTPDEQGRLMVHGLLTATGAYRVSYRTTGCMLLSCCVKESRKPT